MSSRRSLVERIRRGDPIPAPLSLLLYAATPITRLGMALRRRKPVTRVDARVISFGNITAGGTGKTPAVIARAQAEIEAGKKVAVLTRGYHAESGSEQIVSSDIEASRYFSQLGDEATLILKRVPGVLVIKDPDRVRAAMLAIEKFGCDTLILDDGYQYLALHRDENILVVDATNPFGNEALLPRGILREPISAMNRASEVILTRCDQGENLKCITERIREFSPDVPIRTTFHKPANLWSVSTGEQKSLESLKDEGIAAACALGNPEAFLATLKKLGVTLTEFHAFPDHARIPDALQETASMLIVTEKDAMRMTSPGTGVYALSINLEDYTAD